MNFELQDYKDTAKNILSKIEDAIFTVVEPLSVYGYITDEPVTFENRFQGEGKELEIGKSWGDHWQCGWLNFKGSVPESVKGKKISLLIDVSGEACIVDENGVPVRGLTTVVSEFDFSLGKPGKREFPLMEEAKGGEVVDIWADCASNDLFGYSKNGILRDAYIAVCNEEVRQLYFDVEVLLELLEHLPEDSARYHSILNALYEATKVLSVKSGLSGCEFLEGGVVTQQEVTTIDEAEVLRAREILKKELDKKCGDESLSLSAIGHAHIDLAWLWPIRETMRKGARTFATALANMEKYPDYIFGASQPQLYEWVKEQHPELYAKVKERIAEGRWEAQGAMWVEPDTNVPSGEALVRQVLYGKKFFKEEFNKDMKSLWLPDVFGYSAALPQILKKSGVDYFMTIKLSWNKFNTFPHHTFMWEGLDGTQILSHMPPEGTYNSSAAPRAVRAAEKGFQEKGTSDKCLMLFGIGDGGGGPGVEHLERLKREKQLSGLAPVKQEHSTDFFKEIEKDSHKYNVWSGELYLEKHQGTYTTHGKNKKYNRKMEVALKNLELAAVQAMMTNGAEYPQEEIEKIWKEVLLYQFHDILPGSSITRVYTESLEAYERMLARVEELTESIYKGMLNAENGEQGALLVNTLSWNRQQWIKLYDSWTKVSVDSMSSKALKREYITPSQCLGYINAEDGVLENDEIRVEFNENGTIGSVFHKNEEKEVLRDGIGNELRVYEDNGDGWDFSTVFKDRPSSTFKLKEVQYYVDGPKAVAKQTYEYNKSTLVQEVIVTEGSSRIDFDTKVNWNEDGRMLRTSFDVNVLARESTCEIQFGNIKRPTHENTSWDRAKTEVCAHKWVDLSQRNFGVALLNDCKYGHNVTESTMDLNLLRSPAFPDGKADRGYHEFTYSLYPHKGDYIEGKVVREAYELNIPLQTIITDNISDMNPVEKALLSINNEDIIIEAVKKAEDNDDIIIRLYECHGNDARVKLNFNIDAEDIKLVNLMEEIVETDKFNKEKLELKFSPFEIHTLRVKL